MYSMYDLNLLDELERRRVIDSFVVADDAAQELENGLVAEFLSALLHDEVELGGDLFDSLQVLQRSE